METVRLLGFLADVVGIAGALFASFAWWQAKKLRQETKQEQERLRQKIHIVLKLTDGDRQIDLPVDLRRAELTRAELLGFLGMVPMKNKGRRFSLHYLSTPDFFKELDRIQRSTRNEALVIPCTVDEINQFDVQV